MATLAADGRGGRGTGGWARVTRPDPRGRPPSVQRNGLALSEQRGRRLQCKAPAVFEALVVMVVVVVVVSPCYTTCPLTSCHCFPPFLPPSLPLSFFLAQGEALRQILVNRYYGNFHRSGGRRESLTSFGNGPLSPVGPGKNQSGGKKLLLLLLI